MADAVGALYVKLTAATAQFSRDMQKAQGTLGRFEKSAKKTGLAVKAFFAAYVASRGIAAMREASALAIKQEQAEKKLANALRVTGESAGFSLRELKAFASQRQKLTNFGDEDTIAAMGVLSTFVNIQGKEFKDAMILAQDLSSAMGTDLKSSVVQLGKALNDPITGLSALTRIGVSFTAGEKEKIKALQQSGKLMEAQRMMLDAINQQGFAGMAEEMAEDITQLKNAWGDVKEMIGKQVNKELLATVEITKEAVRQAKSLFSVKRSPGDTGDFSVMGSIAKAQKNSTEIWNDFFLTKGGTDLPQGYLTPQERWLRDERRARAKRKAKKEHDAFILESTQVKAAVAAAKATRRMHSASFLDSFRDVLGGMSGWMGATAGASVATATESVAGGIRSTADRFRAASIDAPGAYSPSLTGAAEFGSQSAVAAEIRHALGGSITKQIEQHQLSELEAQTEVLRDILAEGAGEAIKVIQHHF